MAASINTKKKTNGRSLNPAVTRSYGAAASTSRARESREVVRHVVCPGDTLPGLALRYGVTVEEIRQENKLWANDSLFLRPELSIPIKRGFGQPVGESESPKQTGSSPTDSDLYASSVGGEGGPSSQDEDVRGLDKSSVSNFFSSFDAQFAEFKSNISRSETSRSHLTSSTSRLAADHSVSASHHSASTEESAVEFAGISPQTVRHVQASRSLQGFADRKARKQQKQHRHTEEEMFEL